MSSYTISTTFDKNRMFVLQKGEINKRLDPFFYSPLNKLAILENTKLPKKKLSEVAELKRGKFSHRPRNDERFFGGKYPFIQTGEIVKASNNFGKIEFSQTLNDLGLSVSKLFDEEVLLITIAANIGDTAILDYPACFPDSIVAISSKDKNVSLKYLNVYFKFLKKYLENLAPSAAQKNLTLEQLAPTPVILPTLANQDTIVQIFDNYILQKQTCEAEAEMLLASIDDYLLKELGITLPTPLENTLKDRMFVSTIKSISGNRLDPFYHQVKFTETIQSIRKSKYKKDLIQHLIVDLKNGIEVREYFEVGTRYLRVTDLTKNGINNKSPKFIASNNEIPDRIKLNTNCILVSRSGSLGLVNIVNDETINSILSSHIFKLELNTELVLPIYMEAFLRSKIGQIQIFRNNNGGVIPEINQDALKSIIVAVPPLDKQKEIANHITDIRQQAQQLKDKTKELLKTASEEIEKILLT